MIPQLVVTSWSEEGEEEYGGRFLHGNTHHWQLPHQIPLMVVLDREILHQDGVREFRHLAKMDLPTPKPGDIHRDVRRWSWKVFAITQPAVLEYDGWVIWIDGDVEFTATPTEEFFDAVCPADKDVTFLGRPWAYASETGFVAYNLALPVVRQLLADMRSTYLSGGFRRLNEWGDAGVFDHCRGWHRALRENDLSGHLDPATVAQNGLHVWPHTVLHHYLTHHKGPVRKQMAYGQASN